MSETLILVGTVIGAFIVIALVAVTIVSKFYRKVEQGKALIINSIRKDPTVTFTGGTVWPVINKAEVMDISVKTIEIDRRGKEGLICQDNIRADIKVTFFIRVNKTSEDVLKVAQNIGCKRASDQSTIEELFAAKFSESLKSAGKKLDFESLYTERIKFRDMIVQFIGEDLNGYALEDAAIDYLEQTPIEALDPENILDAQGIKKITEITADQNVRTNDLKQNQRKAIHKQNVEADETIFELDRQRADAEATRDREIASVQARESAKTATVQSEERARAEKARIKAEEEIQIEEENKLRQIEVAQKNRERIVGIEAERVQKDRELEALQREHDVELRRFEKDKAVEVEKKEIEEVKAETIAVQKSRAEQEEHIKDLRLVSEAKRQKEARVVNAEAEAQERHIKEVEEAKIRKEVANFTAQEKLTLAEADREAADKQAQAKIRLAEGVQAETAAEGLAKVRVKEANAVALEKEGRAEAQVTLVKMEATADGEEKQGLAKVRVKEADADALRKMGLAEAEVSQQKALAKAKGDEEQGLALARVEEAEAAAIEKRGIAEAVTIEKRGSAEASAVREKLQAEATGLAEKAEAMKALDGVGREHEEFRLELDKDREVELAEINIRKDVATAQAEVLSKAFAHADINIIGGDGAFFEQFMRAVTVGKSIDGFVDNSSSVQSVLHDYLEGGGSFTQDLKDILQRPKVDAETLQSLTLSALLAKLAAASDGDEKSKFQALLDKAKELGLDKKLTDSAGG